MTRCELIQALKKSMNLSKSEATQTVKLFFDSIADALLEGERVQIRGLCTFKIKEYASFAGRNPKTGEDITVKPKKLPVLKVGTELKQRVDHQLKTDKK
jgi:integration host factor subunit beta